MATSTPNYYGGNRLPPNGGDYSRMHQQQHGAGGAPGPTSQYPNTSLPPPSTSTFAQNGPNASNQFGASAPTPTPMMNQPSWGLDHGYGQAANPPPPLTAAATPMPSHSAQAGAPYSGSGYQENPFFNFILPKFDFINSSIADLKLDQAQEPIVSYPAASYAPGTETKEPIDTVTELLSCMHCALKTGQQSRGSAVQGALTRGYSTVNKFSTLVGRKSPFADPDSTINMVAQRFQVIPGQVNRNSVKRINKLTNNFEFLYSYKSPALDPLSAKWQDPIFSSTLKVNDYNDFNYAKEMLQSMGFQRDPTFESLRAAKRYDMIDPDNTREFYALVTTKQPYLKLKLTLKLAQPLMLPHPHGKYTAPTVTFTQGAGGIDQVHGLAFHKPTPQAPVQTPYSDYPVSSNPTGPHNFNAPGAGAGGLRAPQPYQI